MLVVGIDTLAWNLGLGSCGLGFWVELNVGSGG